MEFNKMLISSKLSNKQLIIIVLAFAQILFGLLTIFCNQNIFYSLLESQLVVVEGTRTFQAWQKSPVPAYTEFYFFNMLNEEDFLNNSVKPILEERGPYTFREEQEKVNLVWHDDGTISYNRRKYWYFEPELSVGSLNDTVVSLNFPMVTAVNFAQRNVLMQFGLSDILATVEAKLFINRTIGELLFDGYDDPILDIGSSFDEEERSLPFDKFGWFYKRNGTSWADGQLRMHTGDGDIDRLGEIITHNGANTTHAFPGQCSRITGSADGLLSPGKLKNGVDFDIWSVDTCRKLTFKNVGWTSKHGIKLMKYSLSDNVFDNGTKCSENECYENYLPTGVQNVTNCKMNAPAFLSRPHFAKADPFYARQFQMGIHPETEQHESYLLVESDTSIPLELNVKIEPFEDMEYVFKNIPTVYFPVMWFKSTVDLPNSMAGALRFLINVPTIMVLASVVGIIAGVVGIVMVWRSLNTLQTDFSMTESHLEKKGNMLANKLAFIRNLINTRPGK